MKADPKKRQFIILAGLLLILASTLYRLLFPSEEAPGKIPAPQNAKSPVIDDLKDIYLKRNPKKSGGKKETSFQEIDPTIHLERLENFDPGNPLNARNMFSQEVVPDRPIGAINQRNKKTGGSAVASEPNVAGPAGLGPVPGREVVVSSIPINLKFYGIAFDPIRKKRQGFFSEGDNVFFASEGDLLANRYRIIRIGDTTAEIEDVGSKTRRQITMATQ
jgi:hypothetical protein